MKYLLIIPLLIAMNFSNSLIFDIHTQLPPIEEVKDCTFRIHVKNDDGTKTEYIITVPDISWWQCTKIQLGAWWDRNFK